MKIWVSDFESALLNSVIGHFQSVSVHGCGIHKTRSVKRKANTLKLLPFFKKGARLYPFWLFIKGQQFLPWPRSEKVREAFNMQMDIYKEDLERSKFSKLENFKKFLKYLQ